MALLRSAAHRGQSGLHVPLGSDNTRYQHRPLLSNSQAEWRCNKGLHSLEVFQGDRSLILLRVVPSNWQLMVADLFRSVGRGTHASSRVLWVAGPTLEDPVRGIYQVVMGS